jgi:hypothetical protein
LDGNGIFEGREVDVVLLWVGAGDGERVLSSAAKGLEGLFLPGGDELFGGEWAAVGAVEVAVEVAECPPVRAGDWQRRPLVLTWRQTANFESLAFMVFLSVKRERAARGVRPFLFNSIYPLYGFGANYYANYFRLLFWRKLLWGWVKINFGVSAGG